MSTKYVRVVSSSQAAGSPLSGEIAHAFERIRERAFAIYDSHPADTPGCEYEDWRQAERELFEIPECEVDEQGNTCRLSLKTEAGAKRPLTVIVEAGQVTILGHRAADGELNLFRQVSLPEGIDLTHTHVRARRGKSVEVVMAKRKVSEPARRPVMTAPAAGRMILAV